MAKMSREKGKRGEREWANLCKQYGFVCRRTSQYCGKTGDAADVVGINGIHQEVKRVEKINIDTAMEQATRECRGAIPIVAHRKNGKPWYVTMRAADWLQLMCELEKIKKGEQKQND